MSFKRLASGCLVLLMAISTSMALGGCGGGSGPDFEPFLSPFLGILSSRNTQNGGQQINFSTDTVFPLKDNNNPDIANIFTSAHVRFAGEDETAEKTSKTSIDLGIAPGHFLNPSDDGSDQTSSNFANYWTVNFPQLDNLKDSTYLFIVTACTDDHHCTNSAAHVCVQDGLIIGIPGRDFSSGSASTQKTCASPIWDSEGAYGIESTTPMPSRREYVIPDNWQQPLKTFPKTK